MDITLQNETNHFNRVLNNYGKKGLDSLAKSGMINNKTILTTRDGIVKGGKMLGVDLSKHLKFKPYRAIKLAKGISGSLAIAGLAIDAWQVYDKYKKEEAFKIKGL